MLAGSVLGNCGVLGERCERGERNVTVVALVRIAEVLNVPAPQLLAEIDEGSGTERQ
jgi:transcriptional regulator with XRE-family HTH domain